MLQGHMTLCLLMIVNTLTCVHLRQSYGMQHDAEPGVEKKKKTVRY